MKITLPSGREIGDGCKPFIIAEVGSNWTNLDDIKISIQAAKNAGADAVKFQLFHPKALYGVEVPRPPENGEPMEITGIYKKLSASNMYWVKSLDGTMNYNGYLNPEWLPNMKAQCDKLEIEFMCTAFSPELYDIVNPFVNIHKVASAEMTHVRILEKLNTLGKPVILSTGASGRKDIDTALAVLSGDPMTPHTPIIIRYETLPPTALMYCVASYPAQEIDLDMIELMKSTYHLPVGFSDHSTDALVIPDQAVRLGACIIEKHFTAIDAETPDKGHSLNPAQFKKMVDKLRGRYKSSFGATPEENYMVAQHNRRLIAIKDIKPGELFEEGVNFGIYRSLKPEARAFSPFMIDHLNGKTAQREIQAGNGVGPGDI